ncbi:hypothetical protein LSAT2_029036 [Lamellibrachia satsuma]|nr:hypothetical protein LSAT2_029036 [Lamellibrachia satsuma]
MALSVTSVVLPVACVAKLMTDVDAMKTPPPQPKAAVWIDKGTVKLNTEHSKIPTAWLNSDIINAMHITLKVQLGVPGLQDCELDSVFAFSVETSEFIKNLNTASHWLTVAP